MFMKLIQLKFYNIARLLRIQLSDLQFWTTCHHNEKIYIQNIKKKGDIIWRIRLWNIYFKVSFELLKYEIITSCILNF